MVKIERSVPEINAEKGLAFFTYKFEHTISVLCVSGPITVRYVELDDYNQLEVPLDCKDQDLVEISYDESQETLYVQVDPEKAGHLPEDSLVLDLRVNTIQLICAEDNSSVRVNGRTTLLEDLVVKSEAKADLTNAHIKSSVFSLHVEDAVCDGRLIDSSEVSITVLGHAKTQIPTLIADKLTVTGKGTSSLCCGGRADEATFTLDEQSRVDAPQLTVEHGRCIVRKESFLSCGFFYAEVFESPHATLKSSLAYSSKETLEDFILATEMHEVSIPELCELLMGLCCQRKDGNEYQMLITLDYDKNTHVAQNPVFASTMEFRRQYFLALKGYKSEPVFVNEPFFNGYEGELKKVQVRRQIRDFLQAHTGVDDLSQHKALVSVPLEEVDYNQILKNSPAELYEVEVDLSLD